MSENGDIIKTELESSLPQSDILKMPKGYSKLEKPLELIPEAKEEIKKISEMTGKNLDRLSDRIELQNKVSSQYGKIDGFERGMLFLSDLNNCSKEEFNIIKDILIKSLNNKELLVNLQNFFEDEGFISNKEVLELFFKYINKFEKTESAKNTTESAKNTTESAKNTIQETLSNLKNSPNLKIKEIARKHEKNLDLLMSLPPDNPKVKEIVSSILTDIYAESIKEKDPEKKQELKEIFNSTKDNFVSAGLISESEVIRIYQSLEKNRTSQFELQDLPEENNLGKSGGFRRFDRGNTLVRFGEDCNEIITFDDKGKPSEKMVSSTSGYEINIGSIPLIRDLGIIESKINDLGEHSNNLKENLTQVDFSLNSIISELKLDNPISAYNRLKEKRADLNGKEKEFVKIFELKQKITTELDTLKNKIEKLQERKKKYESERNSPKIEEADKQRELARNKISILDTSKITEVLPKEIIDNILEYISKENKAFQVDGVYSVDFNDININKAVSVKFLRGMFAKILGKDIGDIYSGDNLKLINPPKDNKEAISDMLRADPKILDNGVFMRQGLVDRLSKKMDNGIN